MTEREPKLPPPPPGAKHLGRALRFTMIAALLALVWWFGGITADSFITARCWGSGGVWSPEFQLCECANYGGRWEGAQCVRPGP
ncbi:MAG: hypothetical protein IMF08_00085 [Proteobacteria bacterium]|nr:hypothetical protein [Pseudomonadota bacterium]